MVTRPQLLYVGPNAASLREEWPAGDRPFDVGGVPADEPDAALDEVRDADCVAWYVGEGDDPAGIVGLVRDRSASVPLVLLSGDRDLVADGAVPAEATHVLPVGADPDPIAVLTDLTPLIERAVERRRDLSMFESLLETIPLSVYFKDGQSRHVRVSDEMLEMIGPTYVENEEGKRHHVPDDVVGKTDFDLYTDDLAAEAVDDDQTVMETEEPVVDRVEHSYGERGTGTYVATSKAPWYQDDRVVGVLGMTQDVSERKRYQYQLERQNERLERFATMVSHDIRNPLSVALGRLGVAREDGDGEHFDAIERSLERIDDLVDDLLTVTRQGQSVLDPEPVSLASVVEDAWEHVGTGDATLSVATDVELLAERPRLRAMLEGLLQNAVEHGTGDDEPSGDLTVTVGELRDGDGFYVADDGVGIPPDRRDSIFDPGISAADSAGIGLGVVTSIAKAHNWRVAVEESDGGGARFEFHGVRSAHGSEE